MGALSVRAEASAISNVTALPLSYSPLRVVRGAFSSKGIETCESRLPRSVIGLIPNAIGLTDGSDSDLFLQTLWRMLRAERQCDDLLRQARTTMVRHLHDAPVAFPDTMRILSATVSRRSRSGDIIGPCHSRPTPQLPRSPLKVIALHWVLGPLITQMADQLRQQRGRRREKRDGRQRRSPAHERYPLLDPDPATRMPPSRLAGNRGASGSTRLRHRAPHSAPSAMPTKKAPGVTAGGPFAYPVGQDQWYLA